MTKTVIIIAGPTAVGKTHVAIELARHFHTEIISADSRQCFKELNIGVARPSEEELREVPHHFIASHSIHEEITARDFEAFALEKATELFEKHDVIIMVGGTGLYIKAFTEGLDEIPATDPLLRQRIVRGYEEKGIGWLQEEIKKKDPHFFSAGEMKNPRRMMRALEVVESTGQSILDFRKGNKTKRNFRIIKIGLELPRPELNRRINERVDKMMAAGLPDEVKSLLPYKDLNALQTVGYQELFDCLVPVSGGKLPSLNDAADLVKQHTRQYAKRQMTWFRKDKEIRWFRPDEIEKIKGTVADALS